MNLNVIWKAGYDKLRGISFGSQSRLYNACATESRCRVGSTSQMSPSLVYGMAFVLLLGVTSKVCAQETGMVERVAETAEEEFYDPFAYHMQGEHGDAFIPADSDEMPQGIRVLAIMKAKEGLPFAVLRVAGEPHPFYVTEGDVVRVEKMQSVNSHNRHTSGKASASVPDPVYLRIHEISGDSVEISPQKRPQEIHIFQ